MKPLINSFDKAYQRNRFIIINFSYFRFIMRLAPGLAGAAKKSLHLVFPRDAGPSCVAPHALPPVYRKQPGGLLEFVPLHD